MAPARVEGLDAIIHEIHAAALQPDLWPHCLDRIGEILGSCLPAVAIASEASGRNFAWTWSDPNDAKLLRQAHDRFPTAAAGNLGLQLALRAAPGTVVTRDSLLADTDLVRSDFYQEIMRPRDLWHAAVGVVRPGQAHLALVGVQRRRSAGPFEAGDLDLIRRLTPHVGHALAIVVRLLEMEQRERALDDVVGGLGIGVVLTDGEGRVGWANRLASAVLEAGDGLRLGRERLSTAEPLEERSLAAAIRGAAGVGRADGPRRSRGLRLTRPGDGRPLSIVIGPANAEGKGLPSRLTVRIVFSAPEAVARGGPRTLVEMFGLTSREAEVAALLREGGSPESVAGSLNLSLNTVRTHIRHIFQKTGAERLSDLMRILMTVPPVSSEC